MNEQNNIAPVSNTTPVVPTTPVDSNVQGVNQAPANNAQPVAPIAPIVEETPVDAQPVAPAQPVQPEVTAQSVTPVQPVQPEVTAQPVTPVQPVQPDVAAQPVTPVQPVQPDVAVQQVQPVQPGVVTGLDNNQAVATVANGGITDPNVIAPSSPINGPIDSTNVGFIQTGTELKKKKNPIIIVGIIIVIIAILGAIGYFVIYPKIVNKLADPKVVYKNTIESFSKELSNTITSTIHTKNIFEVKASLESDIPVIKDYSGYTYSGRFGVDPENKLLELGYGITDNSTKTDYINNYYIKNNSYYVKYSTYRDLIYAGAADNSELNEMFETFNTLLKNSNEKNAQNTAYIVEAIINSFGNSIDESKLSKEESSLSVGGQSAKVRKNIYKIDKATAESMYKKIIDQLANDDKFVEAVYEYYVQCSSVASEEMSITIDSKKDVVELLNQLKDTDLEIDDSFNIDMIIYTTGNKQEFAGIEFSSEKDNFHYYTLNNNYEIVLTSEDVDIFSIVGIAKGSITDVSIKIMEIEFATLKISSWTDKEIAFDYVVTIPADMLEAEDDLVLSGNFSMKNNVTNENSTSDITFKLVLPDKTYLSLKVNVLNDWTSDVSNINTSSAKTLTDDEMYSVVKTFNDYLINDTPFGKFNGTLGGITDSSNNIGNDNDYNYDYDDEDDYDDDYDDYDYDDNY